MSRAPLTFANYLSPALHPLYECVAQGVGRLLGMPTRLVVRDCFEQLLDGDVDLGFICGLPYVQMADSHPHCLEALAAPVVRGERYAGRPVYFSDVVVRADSALRCFEDLRGCSWVFNEPSSHSGYSTVLHALAQRGHTASYFGSCVQAGFHHRSLPLLAHTREDA